MRVLIFSTAYYPMVGGAEVAVKEITDRIGDIEFDLITARFRSDLPRRERIGNVEVYRVGVGVQLIDKLLSPFLAVPLAARLHKTHPYDFFWCIMASYTSGGAYILNILRGLAGKKRVPIILTLQEGDSEKHLTRRWGGILHLSWKLSLPRTTILTAISTYLLERAKRLGFRGRAELIPNGVDTRLFSADYPAEELASLKSSLGKKSDDIFLITTSRLNIKNAVSDVIESLKYLPANIKFLVLGMGELEAKLKAETKALGLEERVKFLGFIPHHEMPKYLKISDIFIRPSLSEGMGNSFIEAMAAGLPVIATPVGGIPDFLFDPDANPDVPPTGLFVPPHSPKLIAFQVQKLLNDRVLHDKLVINAKRMVGEKYDWSYITKEIRERVFGARF